MDFRLENIAVRFNKRTSYNVNHIFLHQQNNAAILEIDGFQPFNEFNQPAVLPHVPFNGPSEFFAITYRDENLAHLTQKIRRVDWEENICNYFNDYHNENVICLNIEVLNECPLCVNVCKVSTQSILLFSSSIRQITF